MSATIARIVQTVTSINFIFNRSYLVNPIPKLKKWRSPKYRKESVEGKLCVFCGKPATDFMHTNVLHDKGTSTKASDVTGVPACMDCHRIGEHQRGIETLLGMYPWVNLERTCLQQLNDWMAK